MSSLIDCPSCSRKLRVPDDLLGQKVKCPTCGDKFDAIAPSPDGASEMGPSPAPAPPDAPAVSEPAAAQLKLSLDDEASAPADSAPPPPLVAAQPLPPAASPPIPHEDNLRPCPFCGKRIPQKARRCRFCDEDLDEEEERPRRRSSRSGEERPWERPSRYGVRRDSEPHRGTLVLVLGILSLVFMGCIGLPLGIAAWVMGHRDLKKIAANMMDPQGKGTTQAGWVCGIIGTILSSLITLFCIGWFGFLSYAIWSEQQYRSTRPLNPRPTFKKTTRLMDVPLRGQEYLPRVGEW